MGEMIEFASNGSTCAGYLARPTSGSGPAVIVIQEWWGLVPHITDVCDRFAAAGFFALSPDLYHGAAAANTEPDEAGKLMMSLNIAQAAKDMSGAIAKLQEVSGAAKVGVVGFCMGGGLTLVLACQRPDVVAAAAPFYGLIPWEGAAPDWSKLAAKVEGHYAANDGYFTADAARELEAQLKALGKDATLHIYEGTDHAFFNDTRPEAYVADAAKIAWDRTIALFRSTLA